MELWIRGQEKSLLKKVSEVLYEEMGEHSIVTFQGDDVMLLGIYKTKERCLEIIDEIQKILSSESFLFLSDPHIDEYMVEYIKPTKPIFCEGLDSACKLEQVSSYVYQMPQE